MPPLSLNAGGNSTVQLEQIAWAPGVIYRLATGTNNPAAPWTILETRAQDSMYFSRNDVPSMRTFRQEDTGPDSSLGDTGGQMVWTTGHLWFVGQTELDNRQLRVHRWRPGMDDIELEFDYFRTAGREPYHTITSAAEDGFVWIAYTQGSGQPNSTGTIQRVDTGHRSWISATTQTAQIGANSDQDVTLNIDTTDVPDGTYTATLAFTQYPGDKIAQVFVPITLTVGAGNTVRKISIGASTSPAPTWMIDPDEGVITEENGVSTFDQLDPNTDYQLDPMVPTNN